MSDKKSKQGFGGYVASKDTEPGQMIISENEPEGIIAQYQANKIEQNTALQMMREYHNSQLEKSKHQFLKAVLQNKPLTDIDAERILEELHQKYVDFLQQLGLKDTKERVELLIQLKRQSSQMLAKIDNEDLSEPMKAKIVEEIIRLLRV